MRCLSGRRSSMRRSWKAYDFPRQLGDLAVCLIDKISACTGSLCLRKIDLPSKHDWFCLSINRLARMTYVKINMRCSVHGMACFTQTASPFMLLILCLGVRKAMDSLSSSSLFSTGDHDLSSFADSSGLIFGKQGGSVSGRMCNKMCAQTD